MAKRRNVDGQMRREEYEALDKEREEDSSGNDGLAQGFQKASADVMKKRRIVRVSRDKLEAAKKAQVNKNPFANATLTPSKVNPFASIQLTSPPSAKKFIIDSIPTTADKTTLEEKNKSDNAEKKVVKKDKSTTSTEAEKVETIPAPTKEAMNKHEDTDAKAVDKTEKPTNTSTQVNVRVGVGVLVKDPKSPEKVFAGKRKGSHGAGKLALPGGHLEMFETWDVCGAREVEEETGLKIENIKFAHVTNDPMPDEGKHYITIFMIATCANESDRPKNLEPNKCEGWDSYSLDDLKNISNGKDEGISLFGPLKQLVEESPQSLKDFLAKNKSS